METRAQIKRRLGVSLAVVCAACLFIVCGTQPALAGDSGDQIINMRVPPIFWLGWDNHACDDEGDLVIYNLDETDIMNGEYDPGHYIVRWNTDQLYARSNYKRTSLRVSGGNEWVADEGGDGDFALKINWGDGWEWLDGDDGLYIFYRRNGINDNWNISYRLYGMGLEDDPDTYTTTVVFTLSHT